MPRAHECMAFARPVATGSVPRSIPGWEIDGNRIVSSDHALDWPTRPDRVVIVGAGVIGCENRVVDPEVSVDNRVLGLRGYRFGQCGVKLRDVIEFTSLHVLPLTGPGLDLPSHESFWPAE